MVNPCRHCNAPAVDPLDAELLRLVNLDRDTATIWWRNIIGLTSVYYDRVATREALESELCRLQLLGWIDRTLQGQWVITRSGEEAHPHLEALRRPRGLSLLASRLAPRAVGLAFPRSVVLRV
jgi:hypothetical protein